MLRVLDLFSGLEGWAEGFRARGHDVTTLDNDPRFEPDIVADVLEWSSPAGSFDVVVASPPCECFSTLAFSQGHFKIDADGDPIPMTERGLHAVSLVSRTWDLIDMIEPTYFVIENPRALLRRIMPLLGEPKCDLETVWYCHWGEPFAKPTDLWGGFPATFDPRPVCHNRRDSHPEDCCCHDHLAAPRGSRTGTQGPQDAATRAKIPFELAHEFAIACEEGMTGAAVWVDPLDGLGQARHTDPDTSKEAAALIRSRATAARVRLLTAHYRSAVSLTDEQAATLAGVRLSSEYATRCSELERAGFLMNTGEAAVGRAGALRMKRAITDEGRSVIRRRQAEDR